jgi:hypothetical protein
VSEHAFPAGITLHVTDEGWTVEHDGASKSFKTWRGARRRINWIHGDLRVSISDSARAYEAFHVTHDDNGRPRTKKDQQA